MIESEVVPAEELVGVEFVLAIVIVVVLVELVAPAGPVVDAVGLVEPV